jgi:malate dehydrogenase
MRVTVLGAGSIGSTVAYTLVTVNPEIDVVLVDVDEGKSRGHTIDLLQSYAHCSHAAGEPFIRGRGSDYDPIVEVGEPGPDAIADTDCIVMTAGADRSRDSDRSDGRLKLLEGNLKVVEEIGGWMSDVDPKPVITTTNPLEVITHSLWRESGWPREKFLGYSLAETARIVDEIARRYDTDPQNVYCPVFGEHGGDNMAPIFSRATVDGDPFEPTETEKDEIIEHVLSIPWEVIQLRGGRDSSRWATGRGVVSILQALHNGGTDDPIDLCVPLNGEYGYEDVSLSVAVTLDTQGIDQIIEWDLTEWEREQMDKAFEAVSSHL